MADASSLLMVSGLSKRFGRVPVLSGVSLNLRPGELLLLLGPNGAGKTTLTKVVTTLVRPSPTGAGRREQPLSFRGEPLTSQNRPRYLARLGYLSHQTFLYDHLTAEENLRFFGKLYGVPGAEDRITRLLQDVGLEKVRERQTGTFSRGMLQRLSMARVLLTDPEILVLDEPYSGLDPSGSRTLTRLLEGLKASHRAILLITHELEDCLPIADRVAIMVKGRIVWEAPAPGLSQEDVRRAYFGATGEGGAP